MNGLSPDTSRYRSLHASRRTLARSATLVSLGVFGVGVALFLDQVRPLISDAQFTWGERRVMAIVGLVTLGGFGLAGWVAGRLLRAASDVIEVFVDSAEAAAQSRSLIEMHLVPSLGRAVAALEKLAAAAPSEGHGPVRVALAVRQAIREGRWARAEHLLQALVRDDPNAPEASTLAAELARAHQAEVDDLRTRLDAARAADDPERVIACRDALTQHLHGEPLMELDRRVVRWLADRIQRQVQAGSFTPDLATLAARVADSFGDTAEGASLLAALPNLRRRAGLCPRCGRPYRGDGDACPDCPGDRVAPPPPRPRSGGVIPKGKP